MFSTARKYDTNMQLYVNYFAATYSCGAYGAGNYQESCTTAGAPGAPDTGFFSQSNISLFSGVIGGVLLIAVAVALMLKKKKTTKSRQSK